ncbi:MAG TPA: malto-oligosyltrehalose trehalohydrolase [Stellaceae bacterium]|nr:malto-oligosyltrehalose trehalohydrolase [Stellaceae bacterium]
MRWGATVEPGGATFRLWAPAAGAVEVESGGTRTALKRREDGWFERTIPGAGPGDRYRFIVDGRSVPDPASRFQPDDVEGPSELIDPQSFAWTDDAWKGRPWHEAVILELHVGTFTAEGTYAAAAAQLDRLARLGITAIELMPLADFAGARNWGYDGVLPFAPDSRYGRPEALKALVCEAHRLGLMVLIDVVYNHFGPAGNYLSLYAPPFFAKRDTPWGQGLDFSSRHLRDFFIDNALYWVEEFHVDGLRFDAVHAIADDSDPHFLDELAETVRARQPPGRLVHLVLENDRNEARFLRSGFYDAQWNDDFHHVMHVLLTGEADGYYADYIDRPLDKLGRALTEGFVHQGEWSEFRAAARGEPSRHLPPIAFVNFLQNHDQIGNRAFGERLTRLAPAPALEAATALQLLAPGIPLLFMGEELGADAPFLFFCDFGGDLAAAVRDGRRREFARFPAFASEEARRRIPDPLAIETFEKSRIDGAIARPDAARSDLYRRLLAVRRDEIAPHLAANGAVDADHAVVAGVLTAQWRFSDGARLALAANLTRDPRPWAPPSGDWRRIWGPANADPLPPWTVIWMAARP